MDEFKLKEDKLKDINALTAEACKAVQEEVKPLIIKLSGRYDASLKTIFIEGKSMDNDQVREKYTSIFFDLLFHLPIDIHGKKYQFDFYTYADPSFQVKKHHYRLATAMEALPDTGMVTRAIWKKFTSQLIYTMDGQKQELPEPTPFYDEIESGRMPG